MRCVEVILCKQRLYDRDFIYRVFPRQGFVRDGEEFLTMAAPFLVNEDYLEKKNVKWISDELSGKI